MAWNVKRFALLWIGFMAISPVFSQKKTNAQESLISTDSLSIKNRYEQALQDISYQNFQQAESTLKAILAESPTFDDARIALIRIYFLQKELGKAEILALEGTKIAPKKTIFWAIMADIYKESKNYNALLPVFDQLINLEPDELKNYLDKGFTYSLLENYTAALDAYNVAEQKFGDDESIYAGRSAIYVKQHKNDKAIAELNGYLEKHPTESRSYLQLAHLYLDLKDPNKALETLKLAEERFPDDPDIFLTKADAFQQLKQDDLLLIELKRAFLSKTLPLDRKVQIIFSLYRDFEPEQALTFSNTLGPILIETHPTEPNAYAVYGDILLQQNKSDEALIQFKKALILNPKMAVIWENVLQIEVGSGNYLLAQQDGEAALEQAPQNSMILLFTGYAYLLNKEYEKSRPFIEDALNNADTKNEGLMIQIYSALGDLYNALDMYEVSNVAYDEALAIDSNNTYILNNYAYYLSLRKEQLEKAARFSKRSNELQPDNSSFQDTYAWVLFQQEDYHEALIWIEKALKDTPSPSSTLLEHKGDILSKLGRLKDALSSWNAARKIALKNQQSVEKIELKIKNKKYVD